MAASIPFQSAMDMTASTSSAANTVSVCVRALACRMRRPRPEDDPTHSPTIAPIGATAAAMRRPAARFGRAAGIRMQPEPLARRCAVEPRQVDEARIGAAQAFEEVGRDGEEDDERRHRDLGSQAEAEPHHEQWRDGEDRQRLAGDEKRAERALHERPARHRQRRQHAGQAAEDEAAQDFPERGASLRQDHIGAHGQRGQDSRRRRQDVAGNFRQMDGGLPARPAAARPPRARHSGAACRRAAHWAEPPGRTLPATASPNAVFRVGSWSDGIRGGVALDDVIARFPTPV